MIDQHFNSTVLQLHVQVHYHNNVQNGAKVTSKRNQDHHIDGTKMLKSFTIPFQIVGDNKTHHGIKNGPAHGLKKSLSTYREVTRCYLLNFILVSHLQK